MLRYTRRTHLKRRDGLEARRSALAVRLRPLCVLLVELDTRCRVGGQGGQVISTRPNSKRQTVLNPEKF